MEQINGKALQKTGGQESGRQSWIDFAKFLAILIVLMNHVGLQIPFVNYWGGMFYVPLFFVVSGYLWRPRQETYRSFVKKKAKRLLVPFFVTNLVLVGIYFAADLIRGDYSQTPLRTFGFLYARNQLYSGRETLFPAMLGRNLYFMTALNSPTWFLPALFLTVIFMEALFRLERRKKKTDDLFALLVVAIDMLVAVLWGYVTPLLLPWSLDSLPFFMALFLVGFLLGSQGGRDYLLQRKWNLAVMLVILIVGGIMNGSSNFSVGEFGQSVMLANLNAILSSVLLLFFCYFLRRYIPGVLSTAGQKTLPLLCWHFPVLTAMELVREAVLGAQPEPVTALVKAAEILLTIVLICFADTFFQKGLRKGLGREKTTHHTGTEKA